MKPEDVFKMLTFFELSSNPLPRSSVRIEVAIQNFNDFRRSVRKDATAYLISKISGTSCQLRVTAGFQFLQKIERSFSPLPNRFSRRITLFEIIRSQGLPKLFQSSQLRSDGFFVLSFLLRQGGTEDQEE
ncbi:MAG: hypothetical protein ABF328_07660 [Akkermansiaceae bacterium]